VKIIQLEIEYTLWLSVLFYHPEPLVRNPKELCQNSLPRTHFQRILPYLRCHDKTSLITTSPTVQNVPCSWRPFVNLWFGHYVPSILCLLSGTSLCGLRFLYVTYWYGDVLNSKERYGQGRNNIAPLFADVLPFVLYLSFTIPPFPRWHLHVARWRILQYVLYSIFLMFNILLYATSAHAFPDFISEKFMD
jgi:hypothetical protein